MFHSLLFLAWTARLSSHDQDQKLLRGQSWAAIPARKELLSGVQRTQRSSPSGIRWLGPGPSGRTPGRI